MACKITHRVNDQQIRFANRDAAERYADIMGGGVQNWVFTTVPNAERLAGPATATDLLAPKQAQRAHRGRP
ncbi:hypothetical protein [Saccharomonospora piscinae]|uniref:hypothetical protein n=1 Tax=Saccharomonospora piscinae TaxID=687388 RepID=UPI000464F65A|nr:hypothetical protein [Saccharomonospora piscinae]